MNVKKWIGLVLAALLLCGCGKQEVPSEERSAIDVDLTALSSTMVYSEVFNMMAEPDQYVGKTIRMGGNYAAYWDENTQTVYRVCIIADATACCAQGVEFVLTDENYPELESEITVVGTFQTYLENGSQYCHLVDAVLE